MMFKNNFPLIVILFIVGCNKSTHRNTISTVTDNNIAITPSNRYDCKSLQTVLDSLQQVDSRTTIKPHFDIYAMGRNWYTVDIYGVYSDNNYRVGGENISPQFHTGSVKNWLHVHAINIATAITACTYDRDTFIGIHYIGDDGRVFFTSVVNLKWPNPYVCSGSTAHGWLHDTGCQ